MIVQIINKSTNKLPEYKTTGAVGVDLPAFLDEPVVLEPYRTRLIHTGLYIAVPEGYEAQVRTRSGLALNDGIIVLNSPGTIDPDYRGEIGVILYNTSDEPFIITNGMRVAQLVLNKIEKIEFEEVELLEETERGTDGYGSTGIELADLYDDEIPIDFDYVEEQEDF